jgi:hypothetical protein
VENEIVGFLWGNKKTKIKYQTLIGEYNEGGIKMPDLESMIQANRVRWALKIMNKNTESYWKSFVKIILRPFGGTDILAENFDFSRVVKSQNIKIPVFYKEVFYARSEVSKTNVVNFADIVRQPIWFNRFIHLKIDHINSRYFMEKGILTVNDVWDRFNGPDWEKMKGKGFCDKDYLAWRCIVGALPVEWKAILRNTPHVQTSDLRAQDKCIELLGKFTPVSKVKTSMIYWTAYTAVVTSSFVFVVS